MALFHSNFPASNGFTPLFRLLDDYDVHRTSRGDQPALRSFAARFDVRETDNAYHLDGELPGIAQKDIDIEFTDPQTLVVKGRVEREYHRETGDDTKEGPAQTEKQVAKPKYRFMAQERSVGEFHRIFSFPGRVDQDAVKANLKNGILSITVPKATARAAKRITIE